MPDPPFFLATTSSQQAHEKGSNTTRVSTYFGLWSAEPQKGPDGEDKIDGQLVLVLGTIKYLAGLFKVDKELYHDVFGMAHSNPIILVIVLC